MSWLFSRVLEAEYSQANFSDGEQSALWNVMPSQRAFWQTAKTMAFCRRFHRSSELNITIMNTPSKYGKCQSCKGIDYSLAQTGLCESCRSKMLEKRFADKLIVTVLIALAVAFYCGCILNKD